MNKREKMLAVAVVAVLGGLALLNWVIDPALAAFDAVGVQAEQIKNDLKDARVLVDSEAKILQRWTGYEKAGLDRSRDEADAQTSGALLIWAEKAGFDPKEVNLTNDKPKVDDDKPFAELSYTLNAQGKLSQVFDLLWSVDHSPFPLRMQKCVIDLRNDKSEALQVTLTVTTLYKSQEPAK